MFILTITYYSWLHHIMKQPLKKKAVIVYDNLSENYSFQKNFIF